MIKKRDGSLVDFDINRVIQAVFKAFKQTGKDPGDYPLSIGMVTQQQNLKSVEEIQTFVENQLMMIDHDVARNYITYRYEHDTARKQKNEWAKLGIDIITGTDTESQRENSNVPRDTVTTKVEVIKRLYSKKFVSDFILPEKFKKAHDNSEIHIHDVEEFYEYVEIPSEMNMRSRVSRKITELYARGS